MRQSRQTMGCHVMVSLIIDITVAYAQARLNFGGLYLRNRFAKRLTLRLIVSAKSTKTVGQTVISIFLDYKICKSMFFIINIPCTYLQKFFFIINTPCTYLVIPPPQKKKRWWVLQFFVLYSENWEYKYPGGGIARTGTRYIFGHPNCQ